MILRPALLHDAPALADLGQRSFIAKFAALYSPQDLKEFVRQTYSLDVVSEEIADDRFAHQLAWDKKALVGFCKLRQPSWYARHSDAANPIALSQLYTAPDATGQGIGAALMDWALAESKARHCDAIQLSVYAENAGAQRFYERFGFAKIADITFKVGEQLDPEYLYELSLD